MAGKLKEISKLLRIRTDENGDPMSVDALGFPPWMWRTDWEINWESSGHTFKTWENRESTRSSKDTDIGETWKIVRVVKTDMAGNIIAERSRWNRLHGAHDKIFQGTSKLEGQHDSDYAGLEFEERASAMKEYFDNSPPTNFVDYNPLLFAYNRIDNTGHIHHIRANFVNRNKRWLVAEFLDQRYPVERSKKPPFTVLDKKVENKKGSNKRRFGE